MLINLDAPYGADLASKFEDDEPPVCSFQQSGRTFTRRYLHRLYRETLPDYREPTSEWMREFSRRTLQTIWDNYRDSRSN